MATCKYDACNETGPVDAYGICSRCQQRLAKIREKVKKGILPYPSIGPIPGVEVPLQRIVSGTGESCSGCDEPIPKNQFQHEKDVEGGRIVRLHELCWEIWETDAVP